MKYRLAQTNRFKKDLKKLKSQGKNLSKLEAVVEKLINDIPLELSLHDHELIANYKGYRECHIEPDLLLIYKKERDLLILTLARAGSHSELF